MTVAYDEDETWAALSAAWDLPYGAAQVAAVEQVMAAADAGQWPRLQFAARSLAVVAYEYAGEASKMFVPFAWCLAALDRGDAPDERSEGMVLWRFKHVVSQLAKFPDVPLARTRSILDDMERRYRAGGRSMHAVHQHRWLVAAHVGDAAEAAEQYRLWCAAPRDELSDCIGCEPSARIEHLSGVGADEAAIELSVPVLAGTLTCAEQPQRILTALLLPYLRTGRYEQAADAHRRAYRLLRSSRAELASIAQHVEFCARTGNEPRGLELVQRHLGWLAAPPDPYAEMRFAASAALLLRRLAAAGHGDTELDRPPLAADETTPATTTVAALGDELAARATALAARFDERNGTGHQGAEIAVLLAAEPLADRLPLARAGWGSAAPAPAVAAEPITVPDLPADPAGLADAAERYGREFDEAAERAGWARFDEVCPAPTGELAGRRLVARGLAVSDTDVSAAERHWRAAAELFAHSPVRRHGALSLAGLARCRQDDPETGLAELTAAERALAALAGRSPASIDESISPGTEGRTIPPAGTEDPAGGGERPATGGEEAAAGAGREPAGTAGTTGARTGASSRVGEDPAVAARSALERLAMGLDAADRLPAAISAARQALAIPTDDRHRGRTHALLAFMSARAEDATAALAHGAEAVRLLAGRPAAMVAGVRLLCGGLHAQSGDFDTAIGEFRAAAVGADPTTRAEALRLYGHATLDADRPDEAVEPLTEAIGLWSSLDQPRPVAHLRAALADALARTGRYDEAASVAEDALDGLADPDDAPTRIDTLLLLGVAYRELRATEAAVEALDEVARYCAADGNTAGVGEVNARIAEILDGVDRDAEAAQRWSDSAAAFHDARLAVESGGAETAPRDERVAGWAVDELRAARNAALSWQWAEAPDRAIAALPAADAAAEAAGTDRPRARWEVAVLGYDAGRILASAGRPDEALARTGSAVALFAGLRASGDLDPAPAPVEVAVRTLHARLLLALDRRADARSVLTALLDELPPDAEEHRAAIAGLLTETEHRPSSTG
ncbi:hypothetical protein Athai_04820 [Actinocatenispora thailandica]|uniref:Tetratricopeptide repeat protein n=1 Tax=Actinocatenispora thailandica TaxID=227318 RepID=A0A7R7DJS9_9ACTN|nr:tetratricopeptide repeat protein [Actinocatenispora thailandica]BCJ32979.1 hypothetical protein Athai_04820 [Actinocatenispora thailandica]